MSEVPAADGNRDDRSAQRGFAKPAVQTACSSSRRSPAGKSTSERIRRTAGKIILSTLVSQAAFGTGRERRRFVVLMNGQRYDGAPGALDYKLMEFDRYAIRIEARDPDRQQASTKALPTWTLARDSSNAGRAELLWRIGLPLSAFNLALLAIPLSFVNPRASRSMNLVFAC
jgi:lipopolysaccharide export LptBFGC system permease protein LptF